MTKSEDDLLSISQLSKHLNLTSIRTAQLVEAGTFPTVKVKHGIKFSRVAIDKWIGEKSTRIHS